VKNVATINQDSSGDLKAMQQEVERLKAALRAANAQNHASKRSSEEGQGDVLESRTGGMPAPQILQLIYSLTSKCYAANISSLD
jgi:hypothetical protein